jgi:hypothetical protein
VGSPALTPERALERLGDLSADVRAAIILDASRSLAAVDPEDAELGERLRELAVEMLERAHEADGEGAAEIEVSTPAGSVFVVGAGRWSADVVAARFALSSLMRYDLRRILLDLPEERR